jgi:uncharacterized protein (DUF488 family)
MSQTHIADLQPRRAEYRKAVRAHIELNRALIEQSRQLIEETQDLLDKVARMEGAARELYASVAKKANAARSARRCGMP